MALPRNVGMEVKAMANLFKRQMDGKMPPSDDVPTGAQGMILRFLVLHQDTRDIFQRDVERVFSIRRPTATGLLQLMEKNGLILRESVPYDARLKRLVLTPKALCMHAQIERRIRETEALAVRGLTEEEIEQFFRLADKIKQNLSEGAPTDLSLLKEES